MAKIFIEDDLGNIRIVPMESDEVRIGRANDNDVVLPERNVSRHHLLIRQEEGRFVLSPIAARYGIRMNGVVVESDIQVGFGEAFKLGDYALKLLPADAEVETPAAAPAARGRTSTTSRLAQIDVEAAAREGWRSDFFDEDERQARRSAIVRIVVLFFLLLVAVGLGVVYYRTYVDEDTQWNEIQIPSMLPAHGQPVQPEAPAD